MHTHTHAYTHIHTIIIILISALETDAVKLISYHVVGISKKR